MPSGNYVGSEIDMRKCVKLRYEQVHPAFMEIDENIRNGNEEHRSGSARVVICLDYRRNNEMF